MPGSEQSIDRKIGKLVLPSVNSHATGGYIQIYNLIQQSEVNFVRVCGRLNNALPQIMSTSQSPESVNILLYIAKQIL